MINPGRGAAGGTCVCVCGGGELKKGGSALVHPPVGVSTDDLLLRDFGSTP
jgi:hypothetical protein